MKNTKVDKLIDQLNTSPDQIFRCNKYKKCIRIRGNNCQHKVLHKEELNCHNSHCDRLNMKVKCIKIKE